MVMIQAGSRSSSASTDDQDNRFQAGPVFVPPRRPSAFARRLMEESAAGSGEAVTAYDELWFTGRPTV